MSYLLDDAVASVPLGQGRHRVRITDDWNTANGTPNGGYVLALLQHAATAESVHPDPLSIAVTYFRPALPGDAEISVREVRRGRRVSTYDATLVQDGKEIAHAVLSTHDWDTAGAVEHVPHVAPDVPGPLECADTSSLIPAGAFPILDRYTYRAPQAPGWLVGQPSGVTEGTCWLRAADGRPVDALLAGAMVDAFPPVTAEIGHLASATIQLTVHYRRRPETLWALGHVVTRHVIAGYHDEDVELWDEQGRLVAQSRQLAILAAG
ncbi:thioesterase family protein [Nocardioides sp. zg-536]|uniref:Thioesterase family protein n=1 Tax=Nocardioides faecalis TaxID=2803858 RepID=A0A938YB85_9ACTN|nr:thioesterase family protein [Nocardioides faecalis]MBM9460669.1 thioesterase family protein [Nocardioides faecalis]MBS4752608.1 thioesterase family protein [Nocardioides faecalis]QVI57881.1 thioesterase family protein [Nocardioides faecalis]